MRMIENVAGDPDQISTYVRLDSEEEQRPEGEDDELS